MLKCTSLWQPWASLIHPEWKTIETRSWPTSHRGWLAVHAAKKWNRGHASLCRSEPFHSALKALGFRPPVTLGDCLGPRQTIATFGLPFGAVVAVVRIIDCIRVPPVSLHDTWVDGLSSRERAFGDYNPGRFGWLLGDIQRLEKPVITTGHQGIWILDDEAERKVWGQVRAA